MRKKSTEQLTKDLEGILKRLYGNEKIETVRKIVEDTLLQLEKDRIASKMEESTGEKIDGDESLDTVTKLNESMERGKADKVVELLRELKSQEEIKNECQCSQSKVSRIGAKNKIYSRRQVIKLIRDGKTPEEISQDGNVNLDAVTKLKKELESEKKSTRRDKKDDKSQKNTKKRNAETSKAAKIIELTKELIEDNEIAEKVQCTKVYVRCIRSREKIYGRQKVKKMLLDGKSAEDIALEGNVNLSAVIKLEEQLKEKKKEKPKKKKETLVSEQIVSMATNLTSPKEIAAATYSEVSYVYWVMREKGIYTTRKVTELIELGKIPEEIAKEGNVNVDAVIKLKEKLEKEKTRKKEEAERKQKSKDNRRKRAKLDEQKRKQIIEAAKDLKSGIEIKDIAQVDYSYIYKIMKEEGIFTRTKVKQLIKDGKTPEEIAKEGNVNLDAVINLKNELEQARKKKETCTQQVSVGAVYGKKKIIALIRAKKTDEEIADAGNVSIEKVKTIREQLEQSETTNDYTKTVDVQKEDYRAQKLYSRSSTVAQTMQKSTSENKKTNIAILQMARQVKSIDKIVSMSGIPEYTIRNLLRKNNILPREDVISLINQGEKTPQEIAQESGCDLHEVEKLYARIVEIRKRIEQNPKRKRALELLQKGMSESQIAAAIRISKDSVLEMKELIVGIAKKPISAERKQIDFKIDILNLKTSINSMQQPSKIHAETTDYKIQKILYKYPELLGIKEYTLFAYAYVKAGSYLQAIDIGEEYLGLDTPSISALKTKIEEILNEEKEKKEGQYVGDSTGDEHSGR